MRQDIPPVDVADVSPPPEHTTEHTTEHTFWDAVARLPGAVRRRFPANTSIALPESVPTVLLVEQGAIGRALRQDGGEVIVEVLGSGSWLCSSDAIGDCLGSEWSRVTLAPTTVLQLSLATYRSACTSERWLSGQVLESQARRQQALLERIAVLRDRSPARRVAHTLLYLADAVGHACPLGGGTRLMLSQHVIAAAADLARQTTNRELRRLHRSRVVHVDRGMVCVVDRAMLAEVGAGRLHVMPAPRPAACKLRNPEMTLDCAPLTLRRA